MSDGENYHNVRKVTEIDRLVGQRLRVRRIFLDMTQQALADMLGITFQQVQKYEKGVNRLSASRLFELSDALRVPIRYFFEDIRTQPQVVDHASNESEVDEGAALLTGASQKTIQLMRAFDRIKNENIRRAIVDQVRAIADNERADNPPGRKS